MKKAYDSVMREVLYNILIEFGIPMKICKANKNVSVWHLQESLSRQSYFWHLMFIGPCIIVIVEERKTNLMSLAILFHFLCAQHVSDINISIIRSLRLCCWITTSVVLFSVRCMLEIWCGCFWVVLVLQAVAQVFHSSTITMMHGPINIRFTNAKQAKIVHEYKSFILQLLQWCTVQ